MQSHMRRTALVTSRHRIENESLNDDAELAEIVDSR